MKRRALGIKSDDPVDCDMGGDEIGDLVGVEPPKKKKKVHTQAKKWNGTRLTKFEPWKVETFERFCEDIRSVGCTNTVNNCHGFREMCRKIIRFNTTTPGSIAATELCLASTDRDLQPYLNSFVPAWDEQTIAAGLKPRAEPFVAGVYQTAICSSKFLLSLLDHWSSWCGHNGVERCADSFKVFAGTMELDSNITRVILRQLLSIVKAFSHLFMKKKGNGDTTTAPPSRCGSPIPVIPAHFYNPTPHCDGPPSLEKLDEVFVDEPLLGLDDPPEVISEDEVYEYLTTTLFGQ